MTSRFRLMSTAFKREDEDNKIDPKRMIILSVEGDETERTYFQHLNTHLDRTMIQIEVLRHRHGDGYSDPRHVIELLNEYVDIRQGQLIPAELPESFAEKYSRETIDAYLKNDDGLSLETRTAISEALVRIGIDLEYRRYLQTFDKETDYFAVVLDRDCGNHIYHYLNTPQSKYRDRSEVHYGTAVLTIIDGTMLKGRYYTDRKTNGDIELIVKE